MILDHLGCIEPCKMDRSGTNQQTPIWFAQNWTSETTQAIGPLVESHLRAASFSSVEREAWPGVVVIHAVIIDH